MHGETLKFDINFRSLSIK